MPKWNRSAVPRIVVCRPGSSATSREFLSGSYAIEEQQFRPVFLFTDTQTATQFLSDRGEPHWEPRQLGEFEMREWLIAARVLQGADIALLDVRATGQLLPTRAFYVNDLIEALVSADASSAWERGSFSLWFR